MALFIIETSDGVIMDTSTRDNPYQQYGLSWARGVKVATFKSREDARNTADKIKKNAIKYDEPLLREAKFFVKELHLW